MRLSSHFTQIDEVASISYVAMHILVIKTSSLGDVIHTLPALTDAQQHISNLQCDWVVEEHFAEIPTWHTAVKRVIPVALRRWRKHPFKTLLNGEWRQFKSQLTQHKYDYVIDAQGLIKSAFLTYQTQGLRCGLDKTSLREPLARFAYQRHYAISKQQHAVDRLRQLFATVLNYSVPTTSPNYGISFPALKSTSPTVIFLHGTTWLTKHLPEIYWQHLAEKFVSEGYHVRLPWGNTQEYERAERLANIHPNINLIPKGNLTQLARELAQAQAIIGVDTGLSHLAAALNIPTITLYGATEPGLTGTYGSFQYHLRSDVQCAPCLKKRCIYPKNNDIYPPCYSSFSVETIWQVFKTQILGQ